jgi:hypothetical protein
MPGARQQQSTVSEISARLLVPEISALEQQRPQLHRLSMQALSMQAQQQERVRQLLQQRSVLQKRKVTTEASSEPPQKSPKAMNRTPLNQPPVTASKSGQPPNLPSTISIGTASEKQVADTRWNAYLARTVPGVHKKDAQSAPIRLPQETQQAQNQSVVAAVPEQPAHSERARPQETQQTRNRRVTVKERDNNKRFELLKPHSQAQRKHALKTIFKSWSITEEQLKTLPYAPRRWQQEHSVMRPMDWNGKLLDAVADLAAKTGGDFACGCHVAHFAFENFGASIGAKQLNAEILSKGIATLLAKGNGRLVATDNGPTGPATGGRQGATSDLSMNSACSDLQSAVAGASSIGLASDDLQNANGDSSRRDSANESGRSSANTSTSTSPNQATSKPSLIVKFPIAAQAPPAPQPSPSVAAAHSAPATPSIKTEQVVPIMVRDIPAHDDGHSSSSDERLNLEWKRKILVHQLATAQEQIALDERKKRERERKAKRARQLGSSREEPVVL